MAFKAKFFLVSNFKWHHLHSILTDCERICWAAGLSTSMKIMQNKVTYLRKFGFRIPKGTCQYGKVPFVKWNCSKIKNQCQIYRTQKHFYLTFNLLFTILGNRTVIFTCDTRRAYEFQILSKLKRKLFTFFAFFYKFFSLIYFITHSCNILKKGIH